MNLIVVSFHKNTLKIAIGYDHFVSKHIIIDIVNFVSESMFFPLQIICLGYGFVPYEWSIGVVM